jgi:hypothetical protein
MAILVIDINTDALPQHTDEQLKKWVQDEINMHYDQDNNEAYGKLKGVELYSRDVKVLRIIQ